jgi:hypothetical protein
MDPFLITGIVAYRAANKRPKEAPYDGSFRFPNLRGFRHYPRWIFRKNYPTKISMILETGSSKDKELVRRKPSLIGFFIPPVLRHRSRNIFHSSFPLTWPSDEFLTHIHNKIPFQSCSTENNPVIHPCSVCQIDPDPLANSPQGYL